MEISLSGKNILLTGASRGIRSGIAKQLIASGAKVALHYNQNSEAAHQVQSRSI